MTQKAFNVLSVAALLVAVAAFWLGPAGPPGPKGDSVIGRQGHPGVGVADLVMHGGGHLIVMLTDGRRIDLGRVTGERGEPGDPGAPGAAGAPGPRGPQGAPAPAPARVAHSKKPRKRIKPPCRPPAGRTT